MDRSGLRGLSEREVPQVLDQVANSKEKVT